MPLFMDLHKAADYAVKPTMEEIKRNHIADLAIQHKYQVRFLQYWINEEAGLVFCLMEGPDKEACIAVHHEAHGGMPCNVIELQGGDYQAFMGDDIRANAFDIVEKKDGTLDTGYRIMLVADIISLPASAVIHSMIEPLIQARGGRLIQRPGNRILSSFTEGRTAIECAKLMICKEQQASGGSHEIRIGIAAGEPVTEQQDLFGDTIQLANRLCDIAQNGQTIIAPLVLQLTPATELQQYSREHYFRMLNQEEEHFLCGLIGHMMPIMYQPGFTIDILTRKLGMSKSQLYRKITGLTGFSANAFIRELRLQKALQLIQDKHGNITQVAMEAGFSNPSYFAKNFQHRFGISPLKASKYAE